MTKRYKASVVYGEVKSSFKYIKNVLTERMARGEFDKLNTSENWKDIGKYEILKYILPTEDL